MTRHWPILGLALLAQACTDASLIKIVEEPAATPYDNKLELSGRVCTSDPSDLIFPLKVLFVIDTSQSMNVNDPVSGTEPDPLKQTGRSRAITEVISQFIDLTTPVGNIPQGCSTGEPNCDKGNPACPGCQDTSNPTVQHLCLGPDCVTNSTFKGAGECPAAGSYNGTCLTLCDVTAPGCGPGETNCAPPNGPCAPGDQCVNGACGKQLDPGVEFALMRFGSAKQVLTKNPAGKEGFTKDIKELVTSLPQINNGGSVTDYEGALSKAYKVLYDDMHDMQDNNRGAMARTKYVVVFLSDGQPDPKINDKDDWNSITSTQLREDLLGCQGDSQCQNFVDSTPEYNNDTRILRRVQEIMELRTFFHVGDIKFHAAYLSSDGTPSWLLDQATNLLKQMATVGKGTFTNFEDYQHISFLGHVDFSSLRRVFRMKSFIVSNINAKPVAGSIVMDSDGDGLDDQTEATAGTSPVKADTDGDGFSDTVEYFFRASGWDPLKPTDADCSLKVYDVDGDGIPDDSDGDGLADCEERFLGTSRDLFDSDGDGIPDGLEVKFGTNPVVVDIEDDLDFDGMPNGDEIRLHTDPRGDDATYRARLSYRYQIDQVGSGIETVGRRCLEDKECPSGASCHAGYCRCLDDSGCNSQKACTTEADCTVVGERCQDGKCMGTGWKCQALPDAAQGDELACAAERHITCYEYKVENIALVTPRPTSIGAPEGWNQVNLYFGQVPFDNPMDFGIFSMACVRAQFLSSNGAKSPASGKLTVPETAWHDPVDLTRGYTATATDATGKMACGASSSGTPLYCGLGDPCINAAVNRCGLVKCICPDGNAGVCPLPK